MRRVKWLLASCLVVFMSAAVLAGPGLQVLTAIWLNETTQTWYLIRYVDNNDNGVFDRNADTMVRCWRLRVDRP